MPGEELTPLSWKDKVLTQVFQVDKIENLSQEYLSQYSNLASMFADAFFVVGLGDVLPEISFPYFQSVRLALMETRLSARDLSPEHRGIIEDSVKRSMGVYKESSHHESERIELIAQFLKNNIVDRISSSRK